MAGRIKILLSQLRLACIFFSLSGLAIIEASPRFYFKSKSQRLREHRNRLGKRKCSLTEAGAFLQLELLCQSSPRKLRNCKAYNNPHSYKKERKKIWYIFNHGSAFIEGN
jgi:hypothetical protein